MHLQKEKKTKIKILYDASNKNMYPQLILYPMPLGLLPTAQKASLPGAKTA
jgi:hypothetical protein